ncbi:MAG TPA: DinB family protein [Terriglobia bacterium]
MSQFVSEFPRSLGARRAELEIARERLCDQLEAARAHAGFAPTGSVEKAGSVEGVERAQTAGWSVAEVTYHLHLSENSIARMLRKMLVSGERGEAASDERLLEEWERIRTLVGSRVPKMQAPERVVPKDPPGLEQTLGLLGYSRRQLLEVIAGVADQDLASIYAPHPLKPLGTLAGSSWLSVIAFHDLRHAEQIRELGAGSSPESTTAR